MDVKKNVAVVFDVDGVLIDSLSSHLQFCKDIVTGRVFEDVDVGSLNIVIPSSREFTQMVRGGVRISPMEYFLEAVGIDNKNVIEKAMDFYRTKFNDFYQVMPFDNLGVFLKYMERCGYSMGIVTSNNKRNVEDVLGNLINFFSSSAYESSDKSEDIISVVDSMGFDTSRTIYVGDLFKDYDFSVNAGLYGFVGVNWGWGINLVDSDKFDVAVNYGHLKMIIDRLSGQI